MQAKSHLLLRLCLICPPSFTQELTYTLSLCLVVSLPLYSSASPCPSVTPSLSLALCLSASHRLVLRSWAPQGPSRGLINEAEGRCNKRISWPRSRLDRTLCTASQLEHTFYSWLDRQWIDAASQIRSQRVGINNPATPRPGVLACCQIDKPMQM